jgi:NitT/TauT family transport system substrate-binding protein
MLLLDQNPQLWQETREQTRRFHDPGRFVTLLGFEWTSWIHGHRHVLYFADEGEVLSSLDPRYESPLGLWQALRGKPIYIGSDTRVGSWHFLKAKLGYEDSQIRPYTFSIAPFLVNKAAIQQGYLGSEPFLIEQQGIKATVMLLADAGYESYGALIETSRRLTEDKPDLVRRFVAASTAGWADYLNGDPAPAHALIKRDNPEMTDALLAYGRAKLKDYGIVESGDAATSGIGAMSEARWARFVDTMAGQGLYPRDMDWRRAFTTDFVDHPKSAK